MACPKGSRQEPAPDLMDGRLCRRGGRERERYDKSGVVSRPFTRAPTCNYITDLHGLIGLGKERPRGLLRSGRKAPYCPPNPAAARSPGWREPSRKRGSCTNLIGCYTHPRTHILYIHTHLLAKEPEGVPVLHNLAENSVECKSCYIHLSNDANLLYLRIPPTTTTTTVKAKGRRRESVCERLITTPLSCPPPIPLTPLEVFDY